MTFSFRFSVSNFFTKLQNGTYPLIPLGLLGALIGVLDLLQICCAVAVVAVDWAFTFTAVIDVTGIKIFALLLGIFDEEIIWIFFAELCALVLATTDWWRLSTFSILIVVAGTFWMLTWVPILLILFDKRSADGAMMATSGFDCIGPLIACAAVPFSIHLRFADGLSGCCRFTSVCVGWAMVVGRCTWYSSHFMSRDKSIKNSSYDSVILGKEKNSRNIQLKQCTRSRFQLTLSHWLTDCLKGTKNDCGSRHRTSCRWCENNWRFGPMCSALVEWFVLKILSVPRANVSCAFRIASGMLTMFLLLSLISWMRAMMMSWPPNSCHRFSQVSAADAAVVHLESYSSPLDSVRFAVHSHLFYSSLQITTHKFENSSQLNLIQLMRIIFIVAIYSDLITNEHILE